MATTRIHKRQISEAEGFKEFSYNPDGTLATVTLYGSAAKQATLQTKTFGYNPDGTLATVTIVGDDGSSVVKSFSYDADGGLQDVTSA